jgi:mono/diheme cytochrome c family protein
MRRILLIITSLLFLLIDLGFVQAQEEKETPLNGKELFIKDRCVRCHTIGRGRFVGPDLLGVGDRYNKDEIKKWMENSQGIYQSKGKMPINEGYPPMPPLNVSPEEAEIIADYILTFKAPVATKSEGGIIKGKVENKSTEEPTGDIDVTLTAYLGDRETESTRVRTNRNGFFEFKNLAWNRSYAVSLNYKQTQYVTDRLVFYPSEDTKTLDLPIYEPTDNDKDISVNVNHMIVQISEGAISVAELMVFHNGGKRIYIGAKEIQDGKRETLRFDLPPGAINIQFLNGLTSEGVVKTDRGFIDTSSVEPGIKRVVYAYTLPYKSGKNILEKTIDYPTERFILLVSDSGVKVNVDRLSGGKIVQVADGRFLQWTGSEISPETRIRIEISKPILGQDLLKWVVFGAVIILIGGSVLYSFVIKKKAKLVKNTSTSSVANNSTAISNLEEEKAKLIQEIAELDDRFESKKIGEEEYKEMRSRKKENLIEITLKIKKG